MSERKASMNDKVYRGDVVKYIRNNISLDTFMKRTVQKADESCWDLCDKLNFVPAIEDEQPERKRGKWIKKMRVTETEKYKSYDPEWYCACCGTKYDPHIAKIVNFCYVCGADMRGEQK